MKVQAVSKSERVRVATLQPEDVVLVELRVRLGKVTAKTRVHLLDEPFDAGILDNVEKASGGTNGFLIASETRIGGNRLCRLDPATVAVRREQGMTRFVTDEHIVLGVRHALPHGKRKGTVLEIEVCRGSLRILDDRDVFLCQQTGKSLTDGVEGSGLRLLGGSGSHGVFVNGVCEIKRNGVWAWNPYPQSIPETVESASRWGKKP